MIKRNMTVVIAMGIAVAVLAIVFAAVMISVISEKEKTSAEWKKRQQERLRDEQEGYLEEIDFRVTLAHGKAKTSLYGAGWGVENIRGKVTGSTFTGSSEADSAKVFTTEHGEVSGNITYLLKGKTKWDIRAQARKHGLKGYGASQGVCTDGTHLYVAYSKGGSSNASKVAKVAKYSLASKELLAVSPNAYHLGHVNDLAYDADKRCLISVFSQAGSAKLFVDLLDPDTLEYESRQKVTIPKKVPGLTRKQRNRITSFSGVDVDNADSEVYLRCRNTSIILVVDATTFVAKRGYTVAKKPSGVAVQGITMDGFVLYRSHAQGQSVDKNFVDVLGKDGKLQRRIRIREKGELEGLFIVNGSLYGIIFVDSSHRVGSTYVMRIRTGDKADKDAPVFKPKNRTEKNAYAVWQAMKRYGCTDEAAGGVVGNVSTESMGTFDPMMIQGGARGKTMHPGVGYGICQWTTPSRQQGLKKYAAKHSLKYYSIEAQTGWLVKEMGTQFRPAPGYKYTGKSYRRIKSLKEATKAFCYQWERPGIPHMDSRITAAKKWYRKFKGLTADIRGDAEIHGEVVKGKENGRTKYYVRIEGTLDGIDLAGAKEITAKQYRQFKRNGELSVCGSATYGYGASWDDALPCGKGVQGALSWGKKICDDNRYTYGQGACHSCGKPGYHYVCSCFVVACYAHGAGNKAMLRHCRAQDIMYVPTSYKAYLRSSRDWKELGAIPESRMRPGDVVVWSGHTEIYYGKGKRMGAHDYGGAESISVKDMYGGYLTVFRYQGG